MYLPEFNESSHVIFVGDTDRYKVLYDQWNLQCHILTVVPRLDFAMRIMEESYFTDCLIDLDSSNEEELRWFTCPNDINSYAIAYEKKSLVLSEEVKNKFHTMFFYDESFDYNLQKKGYGLVQDKKPLWKRVFKARSRVKKLVIRLILFVFIIFSLLFIGIFLINLFGDLDSTSTIDPSNPSTNVVKPNMSEKISNSFIKTMESVETMVNPSKKSLSIGSFLFSGDWDALYDQTDMYSNDDLIKIKDSMDSKTIQQIKDNLSAEQKDALRRRFK